MYCIAQFLVKAIFKGLTKICRPILPKLKRWTNTTFLVPYRLMTKTRPKNITVGLISLGCPKNLVDSEKMLGQIAQAGLLICGDPDQADVVVINTCGFIEVAKAESLETIEQVLDRKRKGAVRKVIVVGCLPERLGRDLLAQISGVDAMVGLGWRDEIANVIKETLAAEGPVLHLDKRRSGVADDRARLLTGFAHSPYLRISEGCGHRCSFCTIPAIRGPLSSKPLEIVLAEAAELVDSGAIELNIISQDTTSYGRDLKISDGLATLIAELEKISELAWVRLMYLWPAGIDKRLIERMAASKKVVHYLDIPIQHINDRILRSMKRPDTKESLHGLIDLLRSAMSDIILRTTLIVGFPGETDCEFEELLEFVRTVKFDALGCFAYSREAGTAAAELPEQISESVKQDRLKELMLAQQEIAFAKNALRLGTTLDCLVDCANTDGSMMGRFYGQARDIDSVCLMRNCSAEPGQFVKTRVVGSEQYDMIVEQI